MEDSKLSHRENLPKIWVLSLMLKIWMTKKKLSIENSKEWCQWANSNNKLKSWSLKKNLLDLSTWFNPRLWMYLPTKTKRIRKTRNLTDNSTEQEQDSRVLPKRVLNLLKSTLILKIWLKKRLILIENSKEWCLWANSNNKPKTWSSRKNLLDLSI